MVKAYCGAPEEHTEEDFKKEPVKSLLSKVGIHIVFSHIKVRFGTKLQEFCPDEIDIMERDYPARCNQLIQPNSMYLLTQVERLPQDSETNPILSLLTKRNGGGKTYTINITQTFSPQSREIKAFPDVVKNIIFTEEMSSQEIGWYNKNTNIIWLGDVLHVQSEIKKIMSQILNPIIELKTKGRIYQQLNIGADPEFEILDGNNKLKEANRFFTQNDEIGHDGHPATGEIRPEPSQSPLGLTRNIKRTLRRMSSRYHFNGYKVLVGGGNFVTTGGHIHFDFKGMTKELKDTMYDMVAAYVLKFQSNTRKNAESENYKKDGGNIVREDKPHGLEWRVLPSFIINEEITSIVLCTTYAIVKSFRFYNWRRPEGKVKPRDFYELPLYSAYKPYIDKFIDLFYNGNLDAKIFQKDIIEEWNLRYNTHAFNVEIRSPSAWMQEFFKPRNVNIKKEVILNINFENDGVEITTFGLPSMAVSEIQKFGETHYVETRNHEMVDGNTDTPAIILPRAWRDAKQRSKFLDEFRKVVKAVVIILGE